MWLWHHNWSWLQSTNTSLEVDEGARTTAKHPYVPKQLERLCPAVMDLNNQMERWAAASLDQARPLDDDASSTTGGGGLWPTYAERCAQAARVRAGAPFLYHAEDAQGVAAVDAAPVADALNQHQRTQQAMQQQLEQLRAVQMQQQQVAPSFQAQSESTALQNLQNQIANLTQVIQQQQYRAPPAPAKRQQQYTQQRQVRARGVGGDVDGHERGNE